MDSRDFIMPFLSLYWAAPTRFWSMTDEPTGKEAMVVVEKAAAMLEAMLEVECCGCAVIC